MLALLSAGGSAAADGLQPPWFDEGDPPPPAWARSVVPRADDLGRPGDMILVKGPRGDSGRRGVTRKGATLPFFGEKRGSGCSGRWWLVGPLAWTCSDGAQLSADEPADDVASGDDSPILSYRFVRSDGASAYATLEAAQDGTEDRQLEGGWAVGIVEERTLAGEVWVRTRKGLWIAAHDLVPARPSEFHGELVVDGRLDFAWVLAEHASVWPSPSSKGKATSTRSRFDRVSVIGSEGLMVRIAPDGWMFARDLVRPASAAPPEGVGQAGERWVDVDLGTQTLVAYAGLRPVFATLVSTGRGAKGSDSATPPGVHRIWVKLLTADMDNVERDDVTQHYSMQDVPFVQFFDGAVALHGTYWHRDFGHVHSHGCVNLAPDDARWLFEFTEPRRPNPWAAVFPTSVDPATVVRVR